MPASLFSTALRSHHSRQWSLAMGGTLAVLLAAPVSLAQPAGTDSPVPPPSIEKKTASMKKIEGFLPLYWDEQRGQLWMEISQLGVELLHSAGFGSGLGSNDIGLDRGQLAGSRIVVFERVGPKVLMVQPNYEFRAATENRAEVRAVRDAFARSVLWGFTVGAESGDRVLVDATEWLVRDGLNLEPRLRPGSYRFDETRSAIHLPGTFGFPKNTEIEVELTFVRQQAEGPPEGGPAPGPGPDFGGERFFEGVADVAASDEAASVRVHHSFIELPDERYEPRTYDPRAGYSPVSFRDYAVPLGEPMEVQFIRRHRLEKADPTTKVSDPVEPIVYYLDPGAPEPIRSALARRRALVEPGVRGGRLPQRVPRGGAAGGRASARRALQRDQLGAPIDTRLEHRRLDYRPAHGRDHQRRCHPRLAACAPGLPARRRPAVSLQGRYRDATGVGRVGARTHPPALGS
ncbi:MAG: DUF5117 domain-containing protein [Luteitalea sp.]|nr:DUF5117 domain-containing protein [Luteitalea sp.]